MGIDFKKYTVDPEAQKAVMTIMDPETFTPFVDDKGRTATITLYGPDSTPVKEARRNIQDRILNQAVKGGKRKMNVTSKQLESQSMEVLIAATADWDNLGLDGEDLEPTPENIRRIYEQVPAIKEQVDEFINERSNFLGE